ncbi:uncharacterized protein LOC135349989 isoform X3 [Halichondria panicea]|uniref:uncharacterized protein LOC135349989 isoform X3 n=1 Tax=Halichondria panicea TaxID=6063 RepID=UPI00312BC0BE
MTRPSLFEDVLSTGTHGTDCVELRGMLYDLLKHCVTGALDGQDVATFISELTSIYDLDTDLPSVLSDLLAVLDAETISNENKENCWRAAAERTTRDGNTGASQSGPFS